MDFYKQINGKQIGRAVAIDLYLIDKNTVDPIDPSLSRLKVKTLDYDEANDWVKWYEKRKIPYTFFLAESTVKRKDKRSTQYYVTGFEDDPSSM